MGTTFGAGDGSTTFNLPNFKGRIPIGVGQGNTAEGGGAGTNRVLGATAGAEKHTQTIGEVGSHGHTATGTDSGHTHGIGFGPASSGSAAADWGASNGVSGYFNSLSSTANISVTVNNSATPTGMDIMNPMVVVTFIIKY
jgi:microcystin-dependent protein